MYNKNTLSTPPNGTGSPGSCGVVGANQARPEYHPSFVSPTNVFVTVAVIAPDVKLVTNAPVVLPGQASGCSIHFVGLAVGFLEGLLDGFRVGFLEGFNDGLLLGFLLGF